jgi:hypothetical protein
VTELTQDPQDPARRPERDERIDRDTGRWKGVAALALLAGAFGVLVSQPGLLLVGVVGVAFAAAAAAATPPAAELGVERSLAADHADAGEGVRVTVTSGSWMASRRPSKSSRGRHASPRPCAPASR